MATLVLTAVGTALGGPIGGALGALAGQSIDAALLAPKARHGPRLGDLAVQTSSYGTAIPKLFGTMRVAGTVIWSTDLQERRSSSGGGKGRPKTVNYSYSVSFAVALSGRPIRTVRRIWADGKLLRGASGDFKSETKYRLYPGDEDQAVDPLIASAEAAAGAPAFRGIAYAMFEDFQLADYGNRIPLLTFEVEADPASVAIGAIANSLSDGLIGAAPGPALAGYAAGGESVRGALEDLASVFPLSLIEDEGRLELGASDAAPLAIPADEEGAAGPNGAAGHTERSRLRHAPGALEIAYYEPARDYQTGLQRAVRPDAMGSAERIALPAVLTADSAKALAEARLDRLEAERSRATVHLPWRHAAIRPGMRVRLAAAGGLWRVARCSLEKMRVRLELLRVPGEHGASTIPASPGRPVAQPDLPIGPTTLRLLDLPLYGDRLADRPQLLVASAGAESGWRGAALSISHDGGASWQSAAATAAPAVLGTALGALEARPAALIDTASTIEVELLNAAMPLESRDDQALVAGANLAVIGDELVQFGRAEQIGSRRFRLSRLLRGRFGTEWASGAHNPGEPFLLIDADTLATIEAPAALIGSEARLLATGLGDGQQGVEARRLITGEALRPPSPVHLRAERDGDGALEISWVRRSRIGWRWLDGADTGLGEESEQYRLTLTGQAGGGRTVTLTATTFRYDGSMQSTDGVVGPVTVSVVQLGSLATSRPAHVASS